MSHWVLHSSQRALQSLPARERIRSRKSCASQSPRSLFLLPTSSLRFCLSISAGGSSNQYSFLAHTSTLATVATLLCPLEFHFCMKDFCQREEAPPFVGIHSCYCLEIFNSAMSYWILSSEVWLGVPVHQTSTAALSLSDGRQCSCLSSPWVMNCWPRTSLKDL